MACFVFICLYVYKISLTRCLLQEMSLTRLLLQNVCCTHVYRNHFHWLDADGGSADNESLSLSDSHYENLVTGVLRLTHSHEGILLHSL